MRRAWSPPGANTPQPASNTTSKSTSFPNLPPNSPKPSSKTSHASKNPPHSCSFSSSYPVTLAEFGRKYIFVDWLQRDVDQIFAKVTDRSLVTSKGLILFPNLLRTFNHCFSRSIHGICSKCLFWRIWVALVDILDISVFEEFFTVPKAPACFEVKSCLFCF